MKRKLLALFLGSLAVLIAGEAALRVGGYVWRGKARYDKSETAGYTILCLGDSYTSGSGESPENSYPRQLEALLNRGGRGKTFSVLNGGIPSCNTAQILQQLDSNIKKAKPDLVLLLAGGANSWNYWGLDSRRLDGARWPARLGYALNSIKLVKLAKLLYMSLHAEPPGLKELYYEEAVACRLKGDDARALELLKKLIELEPGNGNNYLMAADIYSRTNKAGEALAWLEKGIKADPDCLGNFAAAGDTLSRLGRAAEGRKYTEKAFPVRAVPSPRESGTEYELAIRSWIGSDIARIAALCRERGIPLILQNYPPSAHAFFTPEIYYEAAAKNSLQLVDNYSAFSERLGKGRELIGSDPFGHPNAEGYGLMAANAAAAVEKTKIFPAQGQ